MTTRIFIAAALLLQIVGCKAQSKQNRPVDNYNNLVVSGALSIVYTQGDSAKLSVQAKESDQAKVETEVKNGVLYIGSKGALSSDVTVFVSNPKLQALNVSGASTFKAIGEYTVPSFAMVVSGSSEVEFAVVSKHFNCQQSGASKVTLKGKTDSLTADISGASMFSAYALESNSVIVNTTGASEAKVKGLSLVHANATGASKIRIKGSPTELSAEASSASSISRSRDNGGEITDNDTTTFDLRKRQVIIITKPGQETEDDEEYSFKHWHGFSMGANGYLTASNKTNLPAGSSFMDLDYSRSVNFQFNLIERQFNLIHNNLKLVTGFGFDYHIYALSNRTTLNPDTNFTYGAVDNTDTKEFLKNRLRSTYIQVPLLLEFNSSNNPRNSFHIAAGVIGEYLISSRTKQVVKENGDIQKKFKRDNYNLSPLVAKAHVNFGYRNFTVFGEYNLTSLFQTNKGPELYPFTIGVRLLSFS